MEVLDSNLKKGNDGVFTWLGKDSSDVVVDINKILERGHKSNQLVIKENSLTHGETYTFTVKGELPKYQIIIYVEA